MADTVATQVLVDGDKNAVIKFTNISDGTGESAVTKVTAANLSGVPTKMRINRIQASTFGMGVDILWDATTDVLAWHVPADMDVNQDFSAFGGIENNGGTGVTFNIQFTTIGHTAGDRYSVILWLKKD